MSDGEKRGRGRPAGTKMSEESKAKAKATREAKKAQKLQENSTEAK
jgi:hypothetical protein